MVKGFDPTRNDPSKIFLDYVFGVFKRQTAFDLSKAQFYIKQWLNNKKYLQIMKQIKHIDGKNPKLRLKQSCWNINNVLKSIPCKNDQNFPAFTDQKQNTIVICLNNIRNKIQLKQNMDRQLHYLHYIKTKKKEFQEKQKQTIQQHFQRVQSSSLKSLLKKNNNSEDYFKMSALYQGCLQSYKNYMVDDKLRKRMAIKCTKYLFWKRSENKLPIDSLFRFTSKLAQDACQ